MRETQYEIDGIRIYIDGEAEKWDSVKYPYYRIRGRRLTEQQAIEVICCTDGFFYYICKNSAEHICSMDYIVNFHMDWFGQFDMFGWVHPNGIVGINNRITPKYPDEYELIEEWSDYIRRFPFLDLVIAITDWFEFCPERWERQSAIWDKEIEFEEKERMEKQLCFEDLERKELEKNIAIGVWVHDGTVEIMNAERTEEKYLEYERLYEEEDKRIYMPEYYAEFQPDIITRDFLHKCIAAYNMGEPEELIRKNVPDHLIKYLDKKLPADK